MAAVSRLAERLINQADVPHVWLLRGPLGAGKTTLTRAAARRLGVRARVNSPTFTLVQHYPLKRKNWRRLVHIDAYRVRHDRERAALEIHELVADPSALLLIEWPERLGRVAWGRHLNIRLTHRGRGRLAQIRLGAR